MRPITGYDWTGPAINWTGLWTLYIREVRRFLNVAAQTVMGPVVTTLLFLVVLAVALGQRTSAIEGTSYMAFLVPGLIMMAIAQNAFANTSSSLFIAKVQGNIGDFLMAPLSPGELTCGFALGGVTRGVAVGVVMWLAMIAVVPVAIHDAFFVLFHAAAASLMLSLLGIIGAIWSEKFDHIAAVTNFIITPFSFLSGTFYSIEGLPGFWRGIAQLNPFFYLIDGFRYGFTGQADGSLVAGLAVVAVVDVLLWSLAYWMFASGYRLKA